MCVVSYVSDYYRDKTLPGIWPDYPNGISSGQVTRTEFEALKKSVEELRALLLAAKKYDDALGEPHCEHEDKVRLLKQVAKLVGVDLSDVFEK